MSFYIHGLAYKQCAKEHPSNIIKASFTIHHIRLKVHLHGSNLRVLECQYLEKRGPKIQDYLISCNSNITSFIFILSTIVLSNNDYISDACVVASLRSE